MLSGTESTVFHAQVALWKMLNSELSHTLGKSEDILASTTPVLNLS